jgi:hypothetical protein
MGGNTMKRFYYLNPSFGNAKTGQFDKRAIAARSADGAIIGTCIGIATYICIAIPMLVYQVSPPIIHLLCISLYSCSIILGALAGALLGWYREDQRLRRFHNKMVPGKHLTQVDTDLIRQRQVPWVPIQVNLACTDG